MADSIKNTQETFNFQNPQQKMPVSLLMELTSTLKHTTPTFELLASEGEDHEPTFLYRVTVNDMSANGEIGKTKKIAKHSAAKKFLDLIVEYNRHEEWGLGKTSGEAALYLDLIFADYGATSAPTQNAFNEDVSRTNFDADKDNPVGKLQEICSRKRGHNPIYDVIDESGMPHEKVFVVKLRVGKFEQIGKHKTKQGAKHDAARKMLNFLHNADANQNRLDELTIEDNDENEDVNAGQTFNSVWNCPGEQPGMCYLANGSSQQGTGTHKGLADLLDVDLESQIPCVYLLNLFDSIGREENLNIEYIMMPQRRKNGDYQCLVKFSTSAVCAGIGHTQQEAKLSAAYSSLQYLKLVN